MMGREITPQEWAKFIQRLTLTGGNVSKACKVIKISRNAAYEHKKTDENFAALWDEALESVYDTMEQEMYRRAVKGVVEPLIYKGQIVKDDSGNPITIKKYSDRLLELALKSNRPQKFRERLDIDANISGHLDIAIEKAIDQIYDADQETSENIAGGAETD